MRASNVGRLNICPQTAVTHNAGLAQVHMSPLGSGMSVEETVEIYCGEGEQILQWLGYTSCSRLTYRRGAYSAWLPTSKHDMRSTSSTIGFMAV